VLQFKVNRLIVCLVAYQPSDISDKFWCMQEEINYLSVYIRFLANNTESGE
jgi:hypothetical protein